MLIHGSIVKSLLSLGLFSTEHLSDTPDQGESCGVPQAHLESQIGRMGAVIPSASHLRKQYNLTSIRPYILWYMCVEFCTPVVWKKTYSVSTLVVWQNSTTLRSYLSIKFGFSKGVMRHIIYQDGFVTLDGLSASHLIIYGNIEANWRTPNEE